MLGDRIRKLRKQKKMTLDTLAGEELTKGMLSLIENNKAKPSMESLAYIAKQLEVEVTELLEEVSSRELRGILERAEILYNTDNEEITNKYEQLIDLIEPYIENLVQGYESARLLDIYSRCLYYEKKNVWKNYLERAAVLYDQINLTANRAAIGIFHAMTECAKHDYALALNLFLQERTYIEANHIYIDSMTRVNLDYHEALLHFAIGDSEAARAVMNNAIDYSKKHRIFYLINDLYRIAAAQAMMEKDEEKRLYYLKKIRQYGEFAEDMQSIIFCELMDVMSLISEKHHYTRALEKIEDYFRSPDKTKDLNQYFSLEKGKALYGLGQYKKAIICLDKIEIPPFSHHPFDLSLFYEMDSYKALCHLELGDKHKALQLAKTAVEKFTTLPQTPYKDFSQETYDMIKHKM